MPYDVFKSIKFSSPYHDMTYDKDKLDEFTVFKREIYSLLNKLETIYTDTDSVRKKD